MQVLAATQTQAINWKSFLLSHAEDAPANPNRTKEDPFYKRIMPLAASGLCGLALGANWSGSDTDTGLMVWFGLPLVM